MAHLAHVVDVDPAILPGDADLLLLQLVVVVTVPDLDRSEPLDKQVVSGSPDPRLVVAEVLDLNHPVEQVAPGSPDYPAWVVATELVMDHPDALAKGTDDTFLSCSPSTCRRCRGWCSPASRSRRGTEQRPSS